MKKFKRLLFVIAIVFALLSTYLAKEILLTIANEKNQLNFIEVPVAAMDIPAMKEITNEDILLVKVPKEVGENLLVIKEVEMLIHQIALVKIDKGNPFLANQLTKEEIKIPFRLAEDERAITISSSAVISVGGYLKEGAYVDILWTYSAETGYLTSIVFQNVKVLAIGPPNQSEISGDEKTITLKLSLQEAQKLAMMEKNGEIKLLMRPSSSSPIESIKPNQDLGIPDISS